MLTASVQDFIEDELIELEKLSGGAPETFATIRSKIVQHRQLRLADTVSVLDLSHYELNALSLVVQTKLSFHAAEYACDGNLTQTLKDTLRLHGKIVNMLRTKDRK